VEETFLIAAGCDREAPLKGRNIKFRCCYTSFIASALIGSAGKKINYKTSTGPSMDSLARKQ
jgi:hypothetical protein